MPKKEAAKELISAYDFAERKGVSHTAVYMAIDRGDIVPEMIGGGKKRKRKYIDWLKYEHVTFEHAENYKVPTDEHQEQTEPMANP